MKRTITQNYIYRNRSFLIIESDEMFNDERARDYRFFGIERKEIDEDGRLKKSMSIAEMNGNRTLDGCLEEIRNKCDVDYYLSIGMDKAEAICRTFGLMDRLEEMREHFN